MELWSGYGVEQSQVGLVVQLKRCRSSNRLEYEIKNSINHLSLHDTPNTSYPCSRSSILIRISISACTLRNSSIISSYSSPFPVCKSSSYLRLLQLDFNSSSFDLSSSESFDPGYPIVKSDLVATMPCFNRILLRHFVLFFMEVQRH